MKKNSLSVLFLSLILILVSCRPAKQVTNTDSQSHKNDSIIKTVYVTKYREANTDSISRFYSEYWRKFYTEKEVSANEIIEQFNEQGVLLNKITRSSQTKEKKWQEEKNSLQHENEIIKHQFDSIKSAYSELQKHSIDSINSAKTEIKKGKKITLWDSLMIQFGQIMLFFFLLFIIYYLVFGNWSKIVKFIFKIFRK